MLQRSALLCCMRFSSSILLLLFVLRDHPAICSFFSSFIVLPFKSLLTLLACLVILFGHSSFCLCLTYPVICSFFSGLPFGVCLLFLLAFWYLLALLRAFDVVCWCFASQWLLILYLAGILYVSKDLLVCFASQCLLILFSFFVRFFGRSLSCRGASLLMFCSSVAAYPSGSLLSIIRLFLRPCDVLLAVVTPRVSHALLNHAAASFSFSISS